MSLNPEPKRPQYQRKKKRQGPRTKPKNQWTKAEWIEWAAWPIFSKFIRLRDCLATTGTLTHGVCITCGRRYPFSKLQAGHFLPGRMDTVLFDEESVNAQCYRCNVVLAGMWPSYYRIMQERHGQDWIEHKIEEWIEDAEVLTINDLRATTALYTMKYNKLMKGG
jgi:hypothetical protein